MAPARLASSPRGGTLCRWAAAIAATALAGAAPAASREAPRIAYPVLPADAQVTPWAGPRLPYLALPIDDRIAPVDFAMDEDATEPISPAEQARIDGQLRLAQWSQNYRPTPAIWKISDRDTTIYLFGTIHVLPPGFQWRSDALDRIIARADGLIVESLGTDADNVDGLLARPGPSGRIAPLVDRVSPDHRAKLTRFTDGLPPQAAALFDGLPTWTAAVAVSFVRDIRAGEVPGPGADDWLEANFRARGKPVDAIEDSRRVIARVNAIAEPDQRRMLDAALDAPDRTRAEMRAPIHAWAKGEIGPNSPLTIDMAATTGSSALAGPLIDLRNRAWTTALIARLRRPGVFLFAAGAGHFVGADSVIEQLRRRGVRVTRVE